MKNKEVKNMQIIIYILLVLSLFAWVGYFIIIMVNFRKMPHLSIKTSKNPLGKSPLVSIVIPSWSKINL
jgi:uncharacterized protein with PQ loop repeat